MKKLGVYEDRLKAVKEVFLSGLGKPSALDFKI